jgi:hypothetical protein
MRHIVLIYIVQLYPIVSSTSPDLAGLNMPRIVNHVNFIAKPECADQLVEMFRTSLPDILKEKGVEQYVGMYYLPPIHAGSFPPTMSPLSDDLRFLRFLSQSSYMHVLNYSLMLPPSYTLSLRSHSFQDLRGLFFARGTRWSHEWRVSEVEIVYGEAPAAYWTTIN